GEPSYKLTPAARSIFPRRRHSTCSPWHRTCFPRDDPMHLKVYWQLLRDTFNNWLEDRALRMGAALAYYSVFSMAPLLLIVIGITSYFFDKQAAREQILDQIGTTVGPSA